MKFSKNSVLKEKISKKISPYTFKEEVHCLLPKKGKLLHIACKKYSKHLIDCSYSYSKITDIIHIQKYLDIFVFVFIDKQFEYGYSDICIRNIQIRKIILEYLILNI